MRSTSFKTAETRATPRATEPHTATRSTPDPRETEERRGKQSDEAGHQQSAAQSANPGLGVQVSWRRTCCGVGGSAWPRSFLSRSSSSSSSADCWRIGTMDVEVNFGPQEQVLCPASILAGVLMCGAVYEIAQNVNSKYFKSYSGLKHMQKVEWNNRCFSTVHALVAAAVSFYLVLISDLFNEDVHNGIIIDRKSWLSDAMFGVSIGYFLTDLAMILWYYPSLGGKEYLLHHGLSMYAMGLALLSGKAHIYILMVLFTEVTTPFVNLRWYLDVAGQKNSDLYVYNGLALFIGWLIARVILFIYIFIHMYLHFDQVKSIFPLGFYSVVAVPSAVAVLNVLWFWKILKGMLKTLSRRKKPSENGKTE